MFDHGSMLFLVLGTEIDTQQQLPSFPPHHSLGGSVQIGLDGLVIIIRMLDVGKRSNCKRTDSVHGQLLETDGQMGTWKSGRNPARGKGAGSSSSHLSPFFPTRLLSLPTSLPDANSCTVTVGRGAVARRLGSRCDF